MREFGSEHPTIILPDGYFDRLKELKRKILYLRSGREALYLTALTIKNVSENNNPIVLFPAYCCMSMIMPFEMAGCRLVYYRVNKDLTVDTDYLYHLLSEHKPQAILTMNFFGIASTDNAVQIVKDFDARIQVIEDFSHCTFSIRKIFNNQVDFYVSSIRKSLGICDGSVILSKIEMPKMYIQVKPDDFANRRFIAQSEKMRYTWSKDQSKKKIFLDEIRECEGILNKFKDIYPISERSMQMLAMVNGEAISFARRENMCHLWSLLNSEIEMVPGIERCFSGIPFSLPILVDNRDEIQMKLAQRGVYTQLLWPICEEAKAICPISKMMNERMLSVPIDQRYSWDDMSDIANIIVEVIKK